MGPLWIQFHAEKHLSSNPELFSMIALVAKVLGEVHIDRYMLQVSSWGTEEPTQPFEVMWNPQFIEKGRSCSCCGPNVN